MPLPEKVFKERTEEEIAREVEAEERGAAPPTGPYGSPSPFERAPHQDAGHLINDFIGDLQSAGETICEVLDEPFEGVFKVKGPHRLLDGYFDTGSGLVRNAITLVTRWK